MRGTQACSIQMSNNNKISLSNVLRSVQTIAFNLPNDERVRKEKGAKKVMLRSFQV